MGKTMKSNLMALVALLCSFGCNDTNNPNDSNGKEEKLDTVGQWLCSQTASDHTLRAIRGTGKNREVQVCANGCAAAVGCLTGASANTTKSIGNGLSSTEQGLELSGGVNIAQDCVGNCGPIDLSYCGGVGVTLNGEAYTNKWRCIAHELPDGTCRMDASATPCDEGDVCELSGPAPTYAVCSVIPSCANDGDCDNGLYCDGPETCVQGACAAGVAPVFSDSKSCTDDSCDEVNDRVVHTVRDGLCGDNNPCNGTETCQPNNVDSDAVTGCFGGTPLDCGDANDCTIDSCVAGVGCNHNAAAANTNACDDGVACTINDACNNGACVGQADCQAPSVCQVGSCENDGQCSFVNVADGMGCGLNSICVQGACAANSCLANDSPVCSQVGGNLGYYECQLPFPGAHFGLRVEMQRCGAIGDPQVACANGAGCFNPLACEVDADCAPLQRCAGICINRDTDADGIIDAQDNCIDDANPAQADADQDGHGDVCDNCPAFSNPDQADVDNDGIGDACSPILDADGDGIDDAQDNCSVDPNADQADQDQDGFGNVCDNCPLVANPGQADVDNDGIGDACAGGELCGNGLDDNANGGFDELCQPALLQALCGTWPAGSHLQFWGNVGEYLGEIIGDGSEICRPNPTIAFERVLSITGPNVPGVTCTEDAVRPAGAILDPGPGFGCQR